jgi:putative NADH-flavin reductase
MNLVILGANGRTGQLVVQAALQRGMDVTAVVRSADKKPTFSHGRLEVVVGDPCSSDFLKRSLQGKTSVISALGGRGPTKAATSVYYRSASALADAARENGLERVLVTSTALLFREQKMIGKVLRRLVPHVEQSARRMEDILRSSDLNWTSARPGFLNDARNMAYHALRESMPQNGTSVSRQALAAFLMDAVEDPNMGYAAYGVSNAGAW